MSTTAIAIEVKPGNLPRAMGLITNSESWGHVKDVKVVGRTITLMVDLDFDTSWGIAIATVEKIGGARRVMVDEVKS